LLSVANRAAFAQALPVSFSVSSASARGLGWLGTVQPGYGFNQPVNKVGSGNGEKVASRRGRVSNLVACPPPEIRAGLQQILQRECS